MGNPFARLLAASAFVLAAACSDTAPAAAPALDRFYYPTGLALRHVPAGCTGGDAGCQTQLVVASSNFDLRFDAATGGTVMSVDVDQAVQTGLAPLTAPAQIGVARVGSFGGEVAILDGDTCPGYVGGPQALVASRSQNLLYRVDLDFASAPQQVVLENTFGDAYGVTVACGTFGRFAFVTYLRTLNSEGQLSQINLDDNSRTNIDLGANVGGSIAPAHSTVFDAPSSRLYVTEHFGENSFSPLRWFSLASPEVTNSVDLFAQIRGAELRGIAISSDRTRAYLALRIYDADTAATTGLRPSTDLAGALAVMDITEGPNGQPRAALLNIVPIDRGASEIRVVPRIDPATGKQRLDPSGNPIRDLVAVTCTDDNTVALYDDDTGSVAKVFDICQGTAGEPQPCAPGTPLTGKQPFGLAVEPRSNGLARLFVGSFDRSWVNVIDIDPLRPTLAPASWARIGPERQ